MQAFRSHADGCRSAEASDPVPFGMRKPIKDRACPNPDCPLYAKLRKGNIVRHSFYRTKSGRRRRFRCTSCGKTFCSNSSTVYIRLQHSRAAFDRVAALSVEGVNKSSIARVLGITWNTVARWLERAAGAARQFNHRMLRGFELSELQADEIRTFVDSKNHPTWVFATIEVSSRLWPSTVIGRRSYSNTRALVSDTIHRGHFSGRLLVSTDGFEYYARVVQQILGPACIYGQVIKTWRKNRVASIETKRGIGSANCLQEALTMSEDSEKLNTSFIERLNLTIRRSSAYLARRTLSHARSADQLEQHLEVVRCHYNFMRPHAALRFGKVTKTPAMQAGLVRRKLNFRDVFLSRIAWPVFAVCLSCLPLRKASVRHLRLAA